MLPLLETILSKTNYIKKGNKELSPFPAIA
jgi:hypothetical protein